MITPLNIIVEKQLFDSLLEQIPMIDFKLTLNMPTGNFFYDPWIISDQFKNSPWDSILKTLGTDIGEARLIKLEEKECYMAHSDIDNRWHFPLITGKSYLIDLDTNKMHKLSLGKWYYMDAGKDHSAVNFGGSIRIQLVVRELLKKGLIKNPKKITIKPIENLYNIRYLFDSIYSPWLNKINRAGLMDQFTINGNSVSLVIEDNIDIPVHKSFEVV